MEQLNTNSKIRVITSGNAPISADLPYGDLAFGEVAGQNKLYGNNGSVIDLSGGVTVHNELTGRKALDCHPVASITDAVEDVPKDGIVQSLSTPFYQFITTTLGKSYFIGSDGVYRLNTDGTFTKIWSGFFAINKYRIYYKVIIPDDFGGFYFAPSPDPSYAGDLYYVNPIESIAKVGTSFDSFSSGIQGMGIASNGDVYFNVANEGIQYYNKSGDGTIKRTAHTTGVRPMVGKADNGLLYFLPDANSVTAGVFLDVDYVTKALSSHDAEGQVFGRMTTGEFIVIGSTYCRIINPANPAQFQLLVNMTSIGSRLVQGVIAYKGVTYFYGRNVHKYESGAFTLIGGYTGTMYTFIRDAAIGQDGRLYFAMTDGIYYLDNTTNSLVLFSTVGADSYRCGITNDLLYFVGPNGIFYLQVDNIYARKYKNWKNISKELNKVSDLENRVEELEKSESVSLPIEISDVNGLQTELTNLDRTHNQLLGRSDNDCHPVESITNAVADITEVNVSINQLSNAPTTVKCSLPYGGRVYYGTDGQGIWVKEANGTIRQTAKTDEIFNCVTYVTYGPTTWILFGSSTNGVWIVDPTTGDIYTAQNTAVNSSGKGFNGCGIGQNGIPYFTSNQDLGVFYYDSGQLRQTNQTTGYFNIAVMGQDNRLYFCGVWYNGIYRLENDGTVVKVANSGDYSTFTASKGQDGRLYFGRGDGQSIWRLNDDWTITAGWGTFSPPWPKGFIGSGLGQDNKLYFGGDATGIWRLDDDGITRQTNKTNETFDTFKMGQDGRLYMNSSSTGLWRLDNDGQIRQVKSGIRFTHANIDIDGKLFFSGVGTGIWQLNIDQDYYLRTKGSWVKFDTIELQNKIQSLENDVATLMGMVSNLILVGDGQTEQELIDTSIANPDSLVVGINVQ